jgi:type VI secretion system protein VasG
VHFIEALSQSARSDFEILCASAGVDASRLAADITRAVDALPHGAGSVEEFSDHIFRAIQEGWTFGSLEFGDDTVRSAYILLGALKVPVLEGLLFKISLEFDKIDPASMSGQLGDLLAESIEGAKPEGEAPKAKQAPGGKSALDQYATNLTERARAGKIDPVIGRDPEIRQIIDILMRRRQNNPILTGEAGVGKTAVVEGFALRLARGDVPPTVEGSRSAHAGRGPDAGRGVGEGRVREAPEAGDRRGAVLGKADHPLHRRSPYPDRGGRGGGHRRCGEPAETGAGAG